MSIIDVIQDDDAGQLVEHVAAAPPLYGDAGDMARSAKALERNMLSSMLSNMSSSMLSKMLSSMLSNMFLYRIIYSYIATY